MDDMSLSRPEDFRLIYDPHKTFLTICDADSLLHRDYFPLLSLKACAERDLDKRRWCMFQPPMMLLRNAEVYYSTFFF